MSAQQAPPVAAPAAAPKMKKKWPWIVLVLLLVSGSTGAAWYVLKVIPAQDQAEAEPPPPPTIYHELRPAFVANLPGGRFLQVELDLMAHDQAVIDAVERHNPAIRNDLLLLLGNQNPSEVASLEGKLNVQREAVQAINTILAKREQNLKVEEVYFSSFVMQ